MLAELKRDSVTLIETIGYGQYGDVFRGTYNSIPVAVKTSKTDEAVNVHEAQLFLHEAARLSAISHHHIVKLVGVCSSAPVWVVLELAPLGALSPHLRHNPGPAHLLLLSCQLASAIRHLSICRLLHRDIAVRNLLLAGEQRLLLSDFGLAITLPEIQTVLYNAEPHMKLPIKWMAVESISQRQYSFASEIWMLGVCIWEILTLGKEKPFGGVKNCDVLDRLRSGYRLPQPPGCSRATYNLLLDMWSEDAGKRPDVKHVEFRLQSLYTTEPGNDPRLLAHIRAPVLQFSKPAVPPPKREIPIRNGFARLRIASTGSHSRPLSHVPNLGLPRSASSTNANLIRAGPNMLQTAGPASLSIPVISTKTPPEPPPKPKGVLPHRSHSQSLTNLNIGNSITIPVGAMVFQFGGNEPLPSDSESIRPSEAGSVKQNNETSFLRRQREALRSLLSRQRKEVNDDAAWLEESFDTASRDWHGSQHGKKVDVNGNANLQNGNTVRRLPESSLSLHAHPSTDLVMCVVQSVVELSILLDDRSRRSIPSKFCTAIDEVDSSATAVLSAMSASSPAHTRLLAALSSMRAASRAALRAVDTSRWPMPVQRDVLAEAHSVALAARETLP